MTAIKVIKFLSGREDKAEERKELKGGTEERQKAGGVRCCCTTQQIRERVLSELCEQVGGEGEARGKHKTGTSGDIGGCSVQTGSRIP